MKIIKLLSTNAVIFTGDDLTLSAGAAGGNDWTAPQFNTQNAVLETIPGALPDGYIGSSWTYTDGVWAVLPSAQEAVTQLLAETLAGKKAAAWERIKAKRDTIKSAGAQVGDYWFHTDADSRIQQLGLKDQARDVLAAGGTTATVLQKLGQDIPWQTMSGVAVPMTVQLSFDVVAAVGDLDALCHYVGLQHRAAMEAAADPSVYDFSGDWPATFGG